MDKKSIHRLFGIATNIGSLTTFWVLRLNGKVISIDLVIPLTVGELTTEGIHQKLKDFDKSIQKRICDHIK